MWPGGTRNSALGPNPALIALGGNGLKICHGHLYFTNSGQQFYARVKINRHDDKVGGIEEIYHLPANATDAFDDFAIAHNGVSYIASQMDSLVKITPDRELTTLIGPNSELKLDSPMSVLRVEDEKTVFVVTGRG